MTKLYVTSHGYEYYGYEDLNGRPVEKTKDSHPYSYDAYVLWKDGYEKGNEYSTIYSDRIPQWGYEKYEKYKELTGVDPNSW